MTPGAASSSSHYHDRDETLIHPSVDAALRHFAHFWTHRRHVHQLFSLDFNDEALRQRMRQQAEQPFADPLLSMPAVTVAGSDELSTAPAAVNLYAISFEPLFVIIGIGLALLLTDLAFGQLLCKRASAPKPDEAELKPASPKSSAPSVTQTSSTPSTAEELQEAADEWAYFKKTKCKVLLLSMVLGFASEFLLWMLAPFFPLEAAYRGVSTEVIGLVFACHPIALGLSSQLAPWLMRNAEPFVILQRTLLLQAIFIAGFGLAGHIDLPVNFAACASTNRLLLGLMSGINEPCSQAITLRLVPSHAVAYAFGLIIAARFSAMVVGPVVGGLLYDVGGFPLPFLVCGMIFLALGVLTMWVGATTPVTSLPPTESVSVWRLLRLRGVMMMLMCIFLLWFNVMFLEPCFEPTLAAEPYNLSPTKIGLVLSAATMGMVLTMALSGYLSGLLDPYTQHTIGFLILVAALPYLGPTPYFNLPPSVGLFVGAIILAYIGVGLVGPTQSVLCLRILSQAGLSQHEVASALAAANVTFSTIGSLCGPLVAGALVPKVFAFADVTSVQAGLTAVCYLPALFLLGRYRPGPRPKPCGACITCCSFVNSCCCPCLTCCQERAQRAASTESEMNRMESQAQQPAVGPKKAK